MGFPSTGRSSLVGAGFGAALGFACSLDFFDWSTPMWYPLARVLVLHTRERLCHFL